MPQVPSAPPVELASHEGRPILGAFNVDPDRAVATFAALARLDADVACFGHGEPLLGGAGEQLRRAAPA